MPKLKRRVLLGVYIGFLVLPIYWLVVMSLKTNEEILGELTIIPHHPTFDNYLTILTDSSWYMGYVNSLEYVVMNTALSLAVALPAAYAFSRFQFVGDKHLFFWQSPQCLVRSSPVIWLQSAVHGVATRRLSSTGSFARAWACSSKCRDASSSRVFCRTSSASASCRADSAVRSSR